MCVHILGCLCYSVAYGNIIAFSAELRKHFHGNVGVKYYTSMSEFYLAEN